MPMNDITALLKDGQVEAAFAALAALEDDEPDAISQLGDDAQALYDAGIERETWSDPALASRALRSCLNIANTLDFADGDTPTYLLMRAISQTPGDDALVLEYLREVANTDYYCTSRTLMEVAGDLRDRDRARRLAAAHTIAEYCCVRGYLPGEVYVEALRRAFREARALGVDARAWAEVHAWITAADPHAGVPDGLFAQFADD